ncbi:MAG TPA: cation:proton antiporter [Chitinispirillaceae bacterium]|nr:cation:proton antiporter [Chitinispirillaceae bacterium]
MHIGIILILGIGVLGGILGAAIFQKLHIPQVIGYIVFGLIVGESGFHLINKTDVASLSSFSYFSLGIIGFLVGGELQFETMKKYARQFSAILLAEGVAAFLFAGAGCGIVIYLVCHNVAASIAAGVIFGAIASATDPASTIDVLWEYRTRGILTTTIIAIVALDDGLAMTLYGLGTSVARILTGGTSDIGKQIFTTAFELLGAVVTGFLAGLLLSWILGKNEQKDKTLALSIGIILLVIGVAVAANMDVILAAMTLGTTIANVSPRRSKDLMALIRSTSIPIYVIFFVFVGAQLGIGSMPSWLWLVVVLYVIGRVGGKVLGSYLGGKISNAEPVVMKYTGIGLFPQGGVAVGLSIMASQHLGTMPLVPGLSLGDAVVFTVTATTLIAQLVGPPMVKLAVKKAGEIGKNVTEEDIVNKWKVKDVLIADVPLIKENDSLKKVLDLFSTSNAQIFPVVNDTGKIIGTISLEGMKEVISDWSSWEWLIALDVMESVADLLPASLPLATALNKLTILNVEQLAVICDEGNPVPAGIFDLRAARRIIGEELIRRRQLSGQVDSTVFSDPVATV